MVCERSGTRRARLLAVVALTSAFVSCRPTEAVHEEAVQEEAVEEEAAAPTAFDIHGVLEAVALVLTPEGSGTGFVVGRRWDARYLLTNAHVVLDADGRSHRPIQVVFRSGEPSAIIHRAGVVAADADLDLAILVVERSDAPVLQLLASSPAKDTWVATVGFPYGMHRAVVGNLPSPAAAAGRVTVLPGTPGFPHPLWAEISAVVEGGSSGGPALVAGAAVAGVVTAKERDTDRTFIVPADVAVSYVAEHLSFAEVPAPVSPDAVATDPRPVSPDLLQSLAVIEAPGGRRYPAVVAAVHGNEAVLMVMGTTTLPHVLSRGDGPARVFARPSEVSDETVSVRFPLHPQAPPSVQVRLARSDRYGSMVGSNVVLIRVADPPADLRPVPIAAELPDLLTFVYGASLQVDGSGGPSAGFRFSHGVVGRHLKGRSGHAEAIEMDLGLLAESAEGPIFDAGGRLLAFVVETQEGTNLAVATPAVNAQDALSPEVASSSLVQEVNGDVCRLTGHLLLDDPLGLSEEFSVRVRAGELDWMSGNVEEMGLLGEEVARGAVATAPVEDGLDRLAVDADMPCSPEERWLQIVIEAGERARYSMPHRLPLPSSGEQPVFLPGRAEPRPGRRSVAMWGLAERSVLAERKPPPPAPPAEDVAGCMPLAWDLDPSGLHLLVPGDARHGCDGTVAVDVLASGDGPRCLPAVADWGIVDLAGRYVFLDGGSSMIRVHRPLSMSRDGTHCRAPQTWRSESPHPVVSVSPCGGAVSARVHLDPRGRRLHACDPGRYVWEDGAELDLGPHQLVQLGAGDTALVRTRWRGLALLRPDGLLHEVFGIPAGVCVGCRVISRWDGDGFLIAAQEANDGSAFRLLRIDAAGSANPVGRLYGVDQLTHAVLGPDGTLYRLVPTGMGNDRRIRIVAHRPDEEGETVVLDGAEAGLPSRVTRGSLVAVGAVQLPASGAHPVVRFEPGGPPLSPLRSDSPCSGEAVPSHGRTYALLGGDERLVVDVHDPQRRRALPSWVDLSRVHTDGASLLTVHEGALVEIPDVRRVFVPERERCVPWDSAQRGEPSERATSCHEGSLGRLHPAPGGALALQCTGADGPVLQFPDGQTIPLTEHHLLAVGDGGRLLLREPGPGLVRRLYVRPAGGADVVPVAGSTHARLLSHASRAVPGGFEVVLLRHDRGGSHQGELWRIEDDGSMRRLDTYGPVPEHAGAALDARGALYVAFQGTVHLRHPGKEAEAIYTMDEPGLRRQLRGFLVAPGKVTGPSDADSVSGDLVVGTESGQPVAPDEVGRINP